MKRLYLLKNDNVDTLSGIPSINDCNYSLGTTRKMVLDQIADQGDDLNQGMIIDKKCSFCKVSSDNHDIVRCMGCKEEYHSCCTLQPITHEILDVIGENPSVWWFCIRCLIGSARENNDISKSEKNERLSNTEDLMFVKIIIGGIMGICQLLYSVESISQSSLIFSKAECCGS